MGDLLDPFAQPDAVAALIARWGDMCEHHAALYAHQHRDDARNALYVTDRGTGALAQRGETWNCLAEPLAPVPHRPALLIELAERAFADGAKSMTFEGRNEFLEAVRALAPAPWRFETVRPYYWPVFDLASWDPALPGGRFRDVRNKLNRFQRDHRFTIVDAHTVDPDALVALLDRWIPARERPEGVERGYYESWMRDRLAGFDEARAVLVGDTVAALTCGWHVPNADGDVYSAWGIYDYAFPGVGEYANWDDLRHLKESGYRTADFGGSDTTLLTFKEKFGPARVYETHCLRVLPA